MTDRYIPRAIDGYPAVPDSAIHTYQSSTHWDIHRKMWVTFDPVSHTYRPAATP